MTASNLLGASALSRDIERAAERVLLRRIEGCPLQTLKSRFIDYPKIQPISQKHMPVILSYKTAMKINSNSAVRMAISPRTSKHYTPAWSELNLN